MNLKPIMWQSKEEYDESGPSIVYRKCFGGGEYSSGTVIQVALSPEARASLSASASATSAGVASSTTSPRSDSKVRPVPSPSQGIAQIPATKGEFVVGAGVVPTPNVIYGDYETSLGTPNPQWLDHTHAPNLKALFRLQFPTYWKCSSFFRYK